MGEPKATEMPDAAAAESTSLFRAGKVSHLSISKDMAKPTFIIINAGKQLDEQVRAAARNVDQRTFLAQPHA